MKIIDFQVDPYKKGNYVIKTEVSAEMAALLEKDPEAKKAFADALSSCILAAFSSTRPVSREDTVKEVMDPSIVQTR